MTKLKLWEGTQLNIQLKILVKLHSKKKLTNLNLNLNTKLKIAKPIRKVWNIFYNFTKKNLLLFTKMFLKITQHLSLWKHNYIKNVCKKIGRERSCEDEVSALSGLYSLDSGETSQICNHTIQEKILGYIFNQYSSRKNLG